MSSIDIFVIVYVVTSIIISVIDTNRAIDRRDKEIAFGGYDNSSYWDYRIECVPILVGLGNFITLIVWGVKWLIKWLVKKQAKKQTAKEKQV